ncbi:hypothetical protein KA107_03475 [Candidatus Pacearchaeota archaeon]|nr:hypothetical protein [Candidatus Pacearchaeota archaeon]
MNVRVFQPNFNARGIEKSFSPETLAAILARYSRKGEGIEEILKILEKTPVEKFEETVWSFLDYGHASIGGLTGGVPVGVDKVSMLLPYLTFFLQPKQDGQETSTRYVEFKPAGLEKPENFGIPQRFHEQWYRVMLEGFAINQELTSRLDILGKQNPELVGILPSANDKTRARMIKNFGFDRARYTLPVAGLTNFGEIMTSREWAESIKYLDSFDLPCSKDLAKELRKEITEVTPRLMKHSLSRDITRNFANDFLDRGIDYLLQNGINVGQVDDEVEVKVHTPLRSKYIHPSRSEEELIDLAFSGKSNRYDFGKGYPEKLKIEVLWNNMSIAEARDMNRQRPCKKDTLLAPIGFYMPEISMDEMKKEGGQLYERYKTFLDDRTNLMKKILNSENPRAYTGCLLLGDQTPFEMHTTGDHIAYVLELRTGAGVHFRYDDHCRQAYQKLAKESPALARHIKLGTGEPE